MNSVTLIGVASHLGARNAQCHLGPMILQDASFAELMAHRHGVRIHWRSMLVQPERGGSGDARLIQDLSQICQVLSSHTQALTRDRMPFVVIGGDHSCAMGTWGGVLNATHKPEEFGLIWIDAHMDAHTFATSPSGNIHGMPIAALLGQGGPSLARLCPARGKLSAENLKMMCMRSFEPEEVELLRSLNVTVYSDYELQQCENFPAFFRSVVDRAAQRWERFGISIDLDGVDPNDAPAVGTPEPGGIPAEILCAALRTVQNHQKLVGIEIAEFEPTQDQNHKTRSLISDIIASVYGRH